MPDFEHEVNGSLYEKLNKYYRSNSKLKILRVQEKTAGYTGLLHFSLIVEPDGTLTNIDIRTIGFKTNKKELKKLFTRNW